MGVDQSERRRLLFFLSNFLNAVTLEIKRNSSDGWHWKEPRKPQSKTHPAENNCSVRGRRESLSSASAKLRSQKRVLGQLLGSEWRAALRWEVLVAILTELLPNSKYG